MKEENMLSSGKILLVGAFSQDRHIYMYASSFYTALQAIGFTVEVFNCRVNQPLRMLNSMQQLMINRNLIEKTRYYKPDLIFLVKAETITAATLRHIKKNLGVP